MEQSLLQPAGPGCYGILIPAYNPPPRFEELLERIQRVSAREKYLRLAVCLVDDGSDPPVVVPGPLAGAVHVIRHEHNRGKGAALRSGFAYFLKNPEIRAVITLDADLQHEPERIPAFIAALEAGAGDLIVGARRRDPAVMPWHRIASNALTTWIISALIGQNAYDSQCGFRLYSRRVLMTIHPRENRFHLESEFLIRGGWQGYRVGRVPVPTIYNGASSAIRNLPDTLNFIFLIAKLFIERIRGHV